MSSGSALPVPRKHMARQNKVEPATSRRTEGLCLVGWGGTWSWDILRRRERYETHAREKAASMTEAIVNCDLVVAFDGGRGGGGATRWGLDIHKKAVGWVTDWCSTHRCSHALEQIYLDYVTLFFWSGWEVEEGETSLVFGKRNSGRCWTSCQVVA